MIIKLISHGGIPAESSVAASLLSGSVLFVAEAASFVAESCAPSNDSMHLDYVHFAQNAGATLMTNQCAKTSCIVNGEPIQSGASRRLDIGNSIEIGLSRLVAEVDNTRETCTTEPRQIADSSFAELLALEGQASYNAAFDAQTAPRADIGSDARVGRLSASIANPDGDPLNTLADEYRDAVQYGKRSAYSNGPGHSRNIRNANVHADPFESFANSLYAGSLSSDLLGNRQGIDSIIATLDHFGDGDLFKPEQPLEILELLAPAGIQLATRKSQADLALREHHMVSMDSAFHLDSPDARTRA